MLLKDKLTAAGKHLILASGSPRRRELLAGAGLEFTVPDSYGAEEVYPDTLPYDEVAEYLAVLKSKAYPGQIGQTDILITADTVVLCGGEILGKPASRDEAVGMISALSGRRHTVITGVAIRSEEALRRFSVASDVWFRELNDEEITYYVDTYKPYDKAGAYGIQEWIGYVAIKKIEGSFYNVMGLPIQMLYTELEAFIGRE